jgi:transcriptional regulator GlxA family with amidase domain
MNFAALSVFEVANKRASEKLYDLHVLSESGGPVRSSLEVEVSTGPIGTAQFDTLLVGGGIHVHDTLPKIKHYLQQAADSTRRLASICFGAFSLGEAGLLNGRRATTHWRYAEELQTRFPECRVEPDRIFIADQGIWTSAGMSAGIDLALGMLESDHGRETARLVAAGLVLHQRRAGGQSQHSILLQLDPSSDRIQTVLAYAKSNLHAPLGIEDLARVACLSPRQFTRVFREETGTSAAKAVNALRLEAAKLMLEQSRLPIEAVAKESGFGDRERMRRAFVRIYGRPPQSFRLDAGPVAAF